MDAKDFSRLTDEGILMTPLDPRDGVALEEFLRKARTMTVEELLEDQKRGEDGNETDR